MSTRYHRLARETPEYAWWKMPVTGALAASCYVAGSVVLVGIAFVALAPSRGSDVLSQWFDSAGELDLSQLDFFLLDMTGLAIGIPAILLALYVVGPRPIGYLSSVTGRLRWSWLAHTAVISTIVYLVVIGALVLWTPLSDSAEASELRIDRMAIAAIGVVLLATPFQAAAEEYVFRGYLIQLVGTWTRMPWVAVAVSVPLFVAGHAYELWGLVDVGIFGVMAAILTIRTGGLEAAIAAHTANNVVLFLADAVGLFAATDDSGAGPMDLIPTIVSSAVILLWVEHAMRSRGLDVTRAPIPDPRRI